MTKESMSVDEDREGLAEPRQRNVWVGIVLRSLVALVVLGGIYVLAANYLGNRVPNGTVAHGVQIGNLTPDAARESLQSRLSSVATEPVRITAGDDTLLLDPTTAGLELDLDATLAHLTGVSYDPRVIWDRITDNGGELSLRTSVDQGKLTSTVQTLGDQVATPPKEGEVWLALGKVNVTAPVAGRGLDADRTAAAVAAAWPTSEPVTGVISDVPPQVSAEEIDRFVTNEAEPALAAPVTLKAGKHQAQVSRNQLSRLLTVTRSDDHRLSLQADRSALLEVVHSSLHAVEKRPVNASIRLVKGKPKIVDAKVGTRLDDTDLVTSFTEALYSPDRTVTVPTAKVEPEVGNAEAKAWKGSQVMAEFTSPFPTGPDNATRTENIRIGLSYVNGTVVMPGEQFSLSETLAPISPDRGYVEAGVIQGGRLVKGLGGGLSQVSTTVLNTAWFSGVQLDEFTPHGYYIPRYPAGREATLFVGVVDNRWTNDTDSPILIQTFTEGDTIVMRFWGHRQYTVKTVTGSRRNVVAPGRKTDDSPNCLEQHAEDGFDITVTRILTKGGEEVSKKSYTTHYNPSPRVVCTNPKAG